MSYYGSRRSSGNGIIIGGLIVLLIVLALIGGCVARNTNDSQVTIKVTDKGTVVKDNKNQYRIYTDDETYVISDSLWKGRYRSSNDYARIHKGHTYQCTKWGWRVPFFSMFENLRDCKEVNA